MAAEGSSHGATKRALEDKLFCPRQDSIEDIPVCTFDIAKGVDEYTSVLYAMGVRQKSLAPLAVGLPDPKVPVTPLDNPKKRLSSHFIIKLVDSSKPKYQVDCLIRDTDLYFVGFRRHLILSPEEQQAWEKKKEEKASSSSSSGKKKAKKEEETQIPGPGRWFCFQDKDMRVPGFLNAKSCGISNGYNNRNLITPGGRIALDDVLLTLGTFQDDPTIEKKNIQRVCYTTICEPSRLRTMQEEMETRIREDMPAAKLSEPLWNDIKNWKQLGAEALTGHVEGRTMEFEFPQDFAESCQLRTMGDLVGDNGRVKLVKSHDSRMPGFTAEEIDNLSKKARGRNNWLADKIDPGFEEHKPSDTAVSGSRKRGRAKGK